MIRSLYRRQLFVELRILCRCLFFLLLFPEQHEQSKGDEDPSRNLRDEGLIEERAHSLSDDRGAAGQESKSEESAGEHRSPAVAKRQGEDHKLRLVAQLSEEDKAEGDEEDG